MNTIKEMQCPECGHTESFNIEIGAICCVNIDGVQEAPHGGDTDWGAENWCSCNECAFEGTVEDFLQTATEPGQHTPVPWICHSGMVWQDKPGVSPTGDGEGRLPIARMDREPGNGTEPVERDANATFIVLACNAHEGLLAAAREACDALNCWNEEEGEGWERCKCRPCVATRRLHTDIAKATGKGE